MPTDIERRGWNEIQFVSREEFQQMGPTILQLEITRLEVVMRNSDPQSDFRNDMVRARHAMNQFIACLEDTTNGNTDSQCAEHLRTAIMSLSFQPDGLDEKTKATFRYILDRLNYFHYRIDLIY